MTMVCLCNRQGKDDVSRDYPMDYYIYAQDGWKWNSSYAKKKIQTESAGLL